MNFHSFTYLAGPLLIDPSTGSCPVGQSLTEAECQAADQFGSAWGGAGNWGLPETCGCYVDQNGKRYPNRLTGPCDNPQAGEKMICKATLGICLFLVLCPGMHRTPVEACFATLSNMQCGTSVCLA
jgi:hypothetical protein